jgi:hypothetical protein
LAVPAPGGQVPIHPPGEALVVVSLQKMRQLVNDQVFDASEGLFGEFQVQPDAAELPRCTCPV